MLFGILLVIFSWRKIYKSKEKLVTDGIYKCVRHPQYLGIIAIVLGTLIQWPTILTIFMGPVLIFAYYRLARKEEKDLQKIFGQKYLQYKRAVPMFLPSPRLIRFSKRSLGNGI